MKELVDIGTNPSTHITATATTATTGDVTGERRLRNQSATAQPMSSRPALVSDPS